MKKLIIYGASYVDIIKVIDNIKDIDVIGFLDDISDQREFMGYPIIGNKNNIKDYIHDYYFVNNVFGTAQRRALIFDRLALCKLYSVIDPSVNLNYVTLGKGIYIGEQVCLGAGVNIMDGVSIRGNAYIGHESILGENVYIAPCACILGQTRIGNYSYIGGNVMIRNGITIGENVNVGCGAVVVKDIPDNTTVVGNPAKPIKEI